MPWLDVSDVLVDPLFGQAMTVNRRASVPDENGNNQLTVTVYTPYGVIVPGAPPSSLNQEVDFEFSQNKITVYTKFRLQPPAPNQLADLIIWRGNNYVVTNNQNFSDFGQGYTETVCELQDLTVAE